MDVAIGYALASIEMEHTRNYQIVNVSILGANVENLNLPQMIIV